jgi:hypothetical protein
LCKVKWFEVKRLVVKEVFGEKGWGGAEKGQWRVKAALKRRG